MARKQRELVAFSLSYSPPIKHHHMTLPPSSPFSRAHPFSLTLAWIALTLTACKTKQPPAPGEAKAIVSSKYKEANIGSDQSLSTTSASKKAWLKKSRDLSKELGTRLQAELATALAKGDPARAVQTCATAAPRIAQELSRTGQYQIQRISLKPRNSDNQASATDQTILREFEKLNQVEPTSRLEVLEESGEGQLRYLGGIRIKPLCLTCHGANVSAPLLGAIRSQYPQDQATGYRLGELRGAFRVVWTLPVPQGLSVPNLRAPRLGLLTGGAPSTQDIPRLKQLGVSWIVDLRTRAESKIDEPELVQASGMRHAQLPIRGPQDLSFDSAQRLREILKKAGSSRVFLHCASGNRAGALLALVAFLDGADVESALSRGRAAGLTSLSSRVKALMDADHAP